MWQISFIAPLETAKSPHIFDTNFICISIFAVSGEILKIEKKAQAIIKRHAAG